MGSDSISQQRRSEKRESEKGDDEPENSKKDE